MAKWQRVLDIKTEWGQASDGKLSCKELAKVIVNRLEKMQPLNAAVVAGHEEAYRYAETQRLDLVDQFRAYAEDTEDLDADADWFNDLMAQLYDWGDLSLDDKFGGKKVCWIKTVF